MPDLQRYLLNLERSGPELILESASVDPEVGDGDYKELHRAVMRRPARELGGSQKHWREMGDRSYARAEMHKDFA